MGAMRRRLASPLRLALCLAAASWLPCALAAESEAPAARPAASGLLVPWQTLVGARLVDRADPTGRIQPNALAGFLRFRYPTAVAARGPDIYVADSGAGTLYRFDAALQLMSAVHGVSVLPGTRIRAGADQTLFVLNPGAGEIRRFSRDGIPLQAISDPVSTARFADFSVDPTGRRVYALDALSQRIVAFHPAGRAAYVFASSMESPGVFKGIGAIADGSGGVLVSDLGCRCIVQLSDDGRVAARLGEGELKQPGVIVADRDGRVFVVDAFDNSLKVFQRGTLLASFAAAALGASSIGGIAVDEGFLYIADGAGAKIVVLRISPRSTRER